MFLVHQIHIYYVFWSTKLTVMFLVDQIYLSFFWSTKFIWTFFGGPNSFFTWFEKC